jgi:hypothetical protein
MEYNALFYKGIALTSLLVLAFIAILMVNGRDIVAGIKMFLSSFRSSSRQAEAAPAPPAKRHSRLVRKYGKLIWATVIARGFEVAETKKDDGATTFVSPLGNIWGSLWNGLLTLVGCEPGEVDAAGAQGRRVERRHAAVEKTAIEFGQFFSKLSDAQLTELAAYQSREIYDGLVTTEEMKIFFRKEQQAMVRDPAAAEGHLMRCLQCHRDLYLERYAAAHQ